MKVIKDHKIQDINWEVSEQLDAEGNIIFPYDIYSENKDSLFARSGKTGILINGETSIEAIAADLEKLDIIALEFPVYLDGRCFSHATLLRSAYGYEGDLLAIGDILRDQVSDMERCGINLVNLTEHRDAEDALQAFSEISTPYQGAVDQQKIISDLR